MLEGALPAGQGPVEIPQNPGKFQQLSKTAKLLVITSIAIGVLSAVGVIAFTIAAAVTSTPAYLIGSLICAIALAIILGRTIAHCSKGDKHIKHETFTVDPVSPFAESLYVNRYMVNPNEDRGAIDWGSCQFGGDRTALFADRVIPGQR